MNKKIPTLEELKRRGQRNFFLSKICPHLLYQGHAYFYKWYCTKYNTGWDGLSGDIINEEGRDCLFRPLCEGTGKHCKTFKDLFHLWEGGVR